MSEQEMRAARATLAVEGRAIGGRLFGVLALLLGALLLLFTLGNVYGELADSPDRGTFAVRACTPASGGYDCTGTFTAETGGAARHGTFGTAHPLAGGATVDVRSTDESFTENTYKEVSRNALGGNVAVVGIAVAVLGLGVFALLTGYAPRPTGVRWGTYVNRWLDRRRVTFTQARRRLPARRVLEPLLGAVTGAGLVILVAGLVLWAVA